VFLFTNIPSFYSKSYFYFDGYFFLCEFRRIDYYCLFIFNFVGDD
jgi:hypothetical protein